MRVASERGGAGDHSVAAHIEVQYACSPATWSAPEVESVALSVLMSLVVPPTTRSFWMDSPPEITSAAV